MDADNREQTLRVSSHLENRYSKALMGTGKFLQRIKFHADQILSKSTRAVRSIRVECESSSFKSDPKGLEEKVDGRRVCATTVPTQVNLNQDYHISNGETYRVELCDPEERLKPCTHCGSN